MIEVRSKQTKGCVVDIPFNIGDKLYYVPFYDALRLGDGVQVFVITDIHFSVRHKTMTVDLGSKGGGSLRYGVPVTGEPFIWEDIGIFFASEAAAKAIDRKLDDAKNGDDVVKTLYKLYGKGAHNG